MAQLVKKVVARPIVKKAVSPAPVAKAGKALKTPAPVAKVKAEKVAREPRVIDPSKWREDSHKGYTLACIRAGYTREQTVKALVDAFWSDREDAEKLANRYITFVARVTGESPAESKVKAVKAAAPAKAAPAKKLVLRKK